MNGQERNIRGKSRETGKIAGNSFVSNVLSENIVSSTSENIDNFMRARLDIEDVMKDPFLDKTRSDVKIMISDYNMKVTGNKKDKGIIENEKFIKDACSESVTARNKKPMINELTFEIGKTDISDISAEWVRDWHRKKQLQGAPSLAEKERKAFITNSLKSEEINPAPIQVINNKRKNSNLFVRYASLSAAAIIGSIILISSLLTSPDPEKIFNSYYEPFKAVSTVTRGESNSMENTYSSAINHYKSGDYKKASLGFNEAILKNPAFGSPLFFLGLSDLALGNYDQAITRLSATLEKSGEYKKEAQWYLGLAYMKSGNNLKASEFFDNLSRTKGFYQKPSRDILRRLK